MPKYNHAFDIAFSVVSDNAEALDVDADTIRAAVRRLLDTYTDDEIMENVGAPFNTYTYDEV